MAPTDELNKNGIEVMTITDYAKKMINYYNERPLMSLITAVFAVFWFVVYVSQTLFWKYGFYWDDLSDWFDLIVALAPIVAVHGLAHKFINK